MGSLVFHACLFLFIASALGSPRQRRATAFSFTECGTATATANFKNLALSPDPLTYPGSVKISTTFDVKETLPKDVQVGVRLIKLKPDVDVPCMSNFGSCNYDACTMIEKYKQLCTLFPADIPCTCEIPKGRFSSDNILVKLPNFGPVFGQLLEGNYKGNLTLFSKSSPSTILACAHVTFAVKYIG